MENILSSWSIYSGVFLLQLDTHRPIQNHKIWANHLPHFARILNVAEHESTSRTPYEVCFGKTPDTKIRQLLKLPVDPREDNATVIQLVHKSLKRKAASRTSNGQS
jgi:hypothetical protein